MNEPSPVAAQQLELRTEIIESQKARVEILKRKLEITAILGAIGLGLDQTAHLPKAPLVLCCIPFVCLYVDLLCAHLNLRIMVIGQYIRSTKIGAESGYEQFVEQARSMGRKNNKSAFDLENWASYGSSILLSVAIVGVAIFQQVGLRGRPLLRATWPFWGSALLGIAMTCMVWYTSETRKQMLRGLGTVYESAVVGSGVPAKDEPSVAGNTKEHRPPA